MKNVALQRIRRWLLAACLAACLPLLIVAQDVAAELHRYRLAAEAYERGSSLQMQGRLDDAAAEYRKVISLAPHAVEAYGSLASLEFRRGHADEAIQIYRSLLASYPYSHHAIVYREVGLMELRTGRFVDARGDLERAVTLDPQDWVAYFLLGHTYRRLGDRPAAKDAWQRVLELRPGNEPAQEQLRRLHE